jgi:energy-converting hydrogenase Eha subunit E
VITLEERQQLLDEEHMRLLAIGYFVTGGTYSVLAFFPIIYIVMGLFLALGMPDLPRDGPGPGPVFMGWLFAIVGFVLMIVLSTVGTLQLYVGRCIGRRKFQTLCMVAAGISCIFIPFGTLLGIFTFIVLGRPSVQVQFRARSLAKPPLPPPPSQPTSATTF